MIWRVANMAAHVSIEWLRRDPNLIEALADSFDFVVTDHAATHTLASSVEPKARLQLIARDKSGGEFLLYGQQEHVLHVTSEGQAGVVARDLTEFLQLLVEHPEWFDLLKFSGGGQLDEMKKAGELLGEDWRRGRRGRRGRRLDVHRRLLKERLALEDSPGAIDRLHAAVADLGRDIHVLAPDGSRCDSLFNTFSSAKLRPRPGDDQPTQRTAGIFFNVWKWFRRGSGG
jgi:hypothetical protein